MTSVSPNRGQPGGLRPLTTQPVILIGLSLTLLYALLAIVGGVRGYSPVPFWDMWDGTLGFYMHQQTDISAWWAQHNEHRIILARILFFIDVRYFGGNAVFLLIMNYALAVFTFALLAWCSLRIIPDAPPCMAVVALVVLSLALLWTQENNLTWGFQSQFFLAQLLPLASLLSLWQSNQIGRHHRAWLAVAIALAVVSAGSMANGVLATWLLVIGCVLRHQSIRRTVSLLLIAIVVTTLYFSGYVSPAGHDSFSHVLRESPRGVMWFLFAYLGSPFAHAIGGVTPNLYVAVACGMMVAILASYLAGTALLRKRLTIDLELALAMFVAYLGASALAVAVGRIRFGLGSAVASRYTTPALLVIACVMILGVARLSSRFTWARGQAIGLLLLIPLAFLPLQWQATKHNPLTDLEKTTAALALEMGARDDEQILWIYPDSTRALEIAREASAQNLSIFASPWLRGASESIGHAYVATPANGCGVVPPATIALPQSDGWSRLQGGLVDTYLGDGLNALYLLDEQDVIIGRGILAVPERRAGSDKVGAPFKLYAPSDRLKSGPMKIVVPGICSGAFNYQH
ncbi:hypothetical protein EYC54_04160 [Xanthomonas oryzae]|uniref:hypothetical protein n=1 Tax=Xanthomonas oryzae TaxID=347 RepID=UPI0010335CD4|nr:hypothetical protein [Xanthomonas oryzae]QBG87097.1 hypothetical protein EYC54_04160 [Xanthomonas oryzae]